MVIYKFEDVCVFECFEKHVSLFMENWLFVATGSPTLLYDVQFQRPHFMTSPIRNHQSVNPKLWKFPSRSIRLRNNQCVVIAWSSAKKSCFCSLFTSITYPSKPFTETSIITVPSVVRLCPAPFQNHDEKPKRETWDRPLEFMLALLGYAVGLGNIWRYPYMCMRNGGGKYWRSDREGRKGATRG